MAIVICWYYKWYKNFKISRHATCSMQYAYHIIQINSIWHKREENKNLTEVWILYVYKPSSDHYMLGNYKETR